MQLSPLKQLLSRLGIIHVNSVMQIMQSTAKSLGICYLIDKAGSVHMKHDIVMQLPTNMAKNTGMHLYIVLHEKRLF